MSIRRFGILVVCTGNIGRSPMMEALLRRDLVAAGLGDRVTVSGAGTWARDGDLMEPYAEQVLHERGVQVVGFTAQRLRKSDVVHADLVLTAAREHRSAVVQLVPAALRRTFTLLELARVATALPPAVPEGDDPVTRMQATVARAAQHRVRAADESIDELADPLGAPVTTYRARADEIERAAGRVVDLLRQA